MRSSFIVLLLSLFAFNFAIADESVPAKPLQIALQVYEQDSNKYLAVSFLNHPKWHTYWKNPGDAGLAIELKFYNKDKEIKLNSEEWPVPRKFIEQGDQWAFGYEDQYTIFYKLDRSFQNTLFNKPITLKGKWLICKNICVPGTKDIAFEVNRDGIKSSTPDLMLNLSNDELKTRFLKLPKVKSIPDYLTINLSKADKEKALILKYEVKKTTDVTFLQNTNMFFPLPHLPFSFTHEQIHTSQNSIIGITPIDWDGEYQTPPEALNPNGKFKKPYTLKFLFNDPLTRETYIIEKKFSEYELGILKADNATPVNTITKIDQKKNESNSIVKVEGQETALPYYLFLAFIGGLILNVMPCVLPVISIKLFGLIKYQQESKKRILKHNIFYTLGILTTFTVLATLIVLLKSIGTNVGWGFQLQSPVFIAIMIVGLFIFSLNMFGLFEFGTPGGHRLGSMEIEDNFIGDFLGGVIAVILSTPCSAPFLGTALTFAFTSESFTIFAIFLMIGIGLAFPFIITGIYPNLVSFLPRPGNWMNTLKKVLGLTLILTCIWLFDVFNTLVGGQSHLFKLLVVLLFIFGGLQLRKKEKWLAYVSYLLALAIFVNMSTTPLIPMKDVTTSLIRDREAKGQNWEPWSVDKMNDYKNNRQIVFMDFTAKWCFTCKANERLVLDTDEFKELSKKYNLKLLVGDWTKRDEVISNFLMKNKLVGVPAYFIQKEDGTLINLGETITIAKIENGIIK